MVESKTNTPPITDISQMSLLDAFHVLEKQVAGYNDFVDADEAHFLDTLQNFELLVQRIQQESIFSNNEQMKDIQTEHLKMLMVPCLEADVLFRLMDNRAERVRQAHTYYLEYLKLMKHYNLLEPQQEKKCKEFMKKNQQRLKGKNSGEEESKHPAQLLMGAMEDRETKIANYKLKKMLESNLERLREYRDEEKKREFYKTQIQLSIMGALDQLSLTEMEIQVLAHKSSLTD